MNVNILPTPKLERWKYSNLPAYVSGDYINEPLSVGYDGDEKFIQQDDNNLSIWASEIYQDMGLWDGLQDILSVVIPEDMHVENPVRLSTQALENIKSEGAIHIHLKRGAKCTLFDDIDVSGWMNKSITIMIDEGAELNHIRTGSGDGVVTNLTQIYQSKNSKYSAYAMNTYGGFVRDQIHVRMIEEGASCYLSGTKLLSGKQHCDTCILIEHEAPNCYSNQNYRNILNGQSRGVFQGKVHVHQIAQQTDGYQLCNTIMLSDKCEMDTKPELEIYADDVKCSHGATTAELDQDPLFYLQARGIPKDQAQALLLQAFVTESLEAFDDNEEIYEQLSQKISDKLNA